MRPPNAMKMHIGFSYYYNHNEIHFDNNHSVLPRSFETPLLLKVWPILSLKRVVFFYCFNVLLVLWPSPNEIATIPLCLWRWMGVGGKKKSNLIDPNELPLLTPMASSTFSVTIYILLVHCISHRVLMMFSQENKPPKTRFTRFQSHC